MLSIAVMAFFAVSTSSDQSRLECADLTNQVTTTYSTDDWKSLIKISKRYENKCSSTVSTKDLSSVLSSRALAYRELKLIDSALYASELAVDLDYNNSNAHLEKMKALFSLNRNNEWKEQFRITKIVNDKNIKEYTVRINDSSLPEFMVKEMKSKLELYKAIAEYLDKFSQLQQLKFTP